MDKYHPTYRFVREFLPRAEGATGNKRYEATFSTGRSGVSFGATQGDPRNNSRANDVLKQMLDDAVTRKEIDQAYRDRLYKFAHTDAAQRARHQADGTWMTADDQARFNAVLNHRKSRELIELFDDDQAILVANDLQSLQERMRGRPGGAGVLAPENSDMETLGMLAAWHNRTGDLSMTQEYLMSAPGPLTADMIRNRIAGYKQFRPVTQDGRGEDFGNWAERIRSAVGQTR